VIRAEKASGTRRDGRTELQVLLDFLRAGDTLVVTRIDRLARSLKDSRTSARTQGQGCGPEGDRAADPTPAPRPAKRSLTCWVCSRSSKPICGASGNSRGSAPPKCVVSTKGRKPSIDAAEVIRLRREEKLGPAAIARQLGIGRASVYRLLGKQTAGVSANGGVDADQA
jgi:DNA invertase Pin-like site-specific DNA recombinase